MEFEPHQWSWLNDLALPRRSSYETDWLPTPKHPYLFQPWSWLRLFSEYCDYSPLTVPYFLLWGALLSCLLEALGT